MHNNQWTTAYRFGKIFPAKLLLTLGLLLAVFSSKAQFAQHLTWKSEVEKISETEFKVKFICSLDENWHTYSQYTKEGGPLPTQFRFEKIKTLNCLAKWRSLGKSIPNLMNYLVWMSLRLTEMLPSFRKLDLKIPKRF